MKQKYTIPKAKYELKKPDKPSVQTAEKTEVQEALEILLEGEKPSGIGRKKPTLVQKAQEFRRHMDEMEAGYERNTTHAKD